MKDWDNPLVSVIVPCYNQGEYLRESISSILAQTYRNVEIIIINDGSNDPITLEILSTLTHPSIQIVNVENGGVCKARNIGVSKAKGTFVLPVDDDDCIAPDYIEKCLDIFKSNPSVDVVYGITQLFGEQKGLFVLPKYSARKILVSNMVICGAMYRKADYELVGGYSENMIYGLEDWDYWLKFVENKKKFHRINKVMYYYRVKPVSRNRGMDARSNHQERVRMMRTQIYSNHELMYRENKLSLEQFLKKASPHINFIYKVQFHITKSTLNLGLWKYQFFGK